MTTESHHGNTRAVWAWCFYDWANSAFTTLVVTFIYSAYFVQAFAPDEVQGTALWTRAVSISAIIVALLSPILGAVADRGGRRGRYLLATTLLCVAATTALAFVRPDGAQAALVALTVFVVGNVAFELGMVFYNAFLPDLVSNDRIGRISGYGWGLGYVGGLLCMVVALFGFVGLGDAAPWFRLSTDAQFNVRATNLLVAGWFLVFSVPLFLFVRDPRKAKGVIDVRGAFRDLATTVRHVGRYREIVKFLIARLVYNDGLVTIFALGGVYAVGTFGFTLSEVIAFGIVINVTAGLGAVVFGFVDDRIGGRATLLVSLVALSGATVLAMLAPSRLWLWIAAIGVGIFAGPNQAASRSLLGRFVPTQHQTEFFGFFAFSGKVTSFLGPLFFGTAATMANSQRAGVGAVLVFFVVGGLLLLAVNEQAGIAAADAES